MLVFFWKDVTSGRNSPAAFPARWFLLTRHEHVWWVPERWDFVRFVRRIGASQVHGSEPGLLVWALLGEVMPFRDAKPVRGKPNQSESVNLNQK